MKPINSVTRGYFKPAVLTLALLVLCSSFAIFIESPPAPKPPAPAPGRTALRKAGLDSRVSWYFESGQWRSDARTLVNLLAYLVRSDPSPLTNPPPVQGEAQAGLVSLVPTQS
jgi:hypothetical protein